MRRRYIKMLSEPQYMTIKALTDVVLVSFTGAIEYSVQGGDWQIAEKGETWKIPKGISVSFRNMNRNSIYQTFNISGECELKGNCMSLMPDGKLKGSAFCNLFSNCKGIISVSKDFLPETILEGSCYENMFSGCTNLTTAPELPATKLTSYCYKKMFYGCQKLNYVKMLATDISALYPLDNWLWGVASTGTFVKNPAMTTLSTGTSGIPHGWTVVNDGEESGGGV